VARCLGEQVLLSGPCLPVPSSLSLLLRTIIILCRSWGWRIIRKDIFSGLKYVANWLLVIYSQFCRAAQEG
jgi:hypothetical protein